MADPAPLALLEGADSLWDDVVGGEPVPAPLPSEDDVDATLRALADFVDLKSRWLSGHSSGVAELAATTAGGRPRSSRSVPTGARLNHTGSPSDRVATGRGSPQVVPASTWVADPARRMLPSTRVPKTSPSTVHSTTWMPRVDNRKS